MAMSMTAYARVTTDTSHGAITWEMRSVNNRYLDATLRLPEELRGLDPAIRERLSARLKRGKLECGLRFDPSARAEAELAVDMGLVEQVARACERVDAAVSNPAAVSALDILRWPGVIGRNLPGADEAGEAVLSALDTTLDQFVEGRAREGDKLAALIAERCDGIDAIIAAVHEMMPGIADAWRARMNARLDEVREQLEPGRVEAEMVLFSQKCDVSEELDRLATHITEVRRVLGLAEPVGRRLDFLMQELNREANTLGSKSVDTRSTNASVELKVLIEQMREQVQNLE